jgi:glycosyltransferase involved in cell wall biosynthesis
MMKILQICNKPPYPPRDGGSIAMFNLARSFDKLGHEVTVLTMATPKHKLTEKEKAEFMKTIRLYLVFIDTSLRIWRLLANFFFSGEPYIAARFISDEFRNKLANILKSTDFDIVQLEGLYLAPYINTIRKHSGALIVLRAHNVEHEIWDRIAKNEKNLLKKYYFGSLARRIKHFESAAMNQYDLLVPITKRDCEQFNRMGNIRPALVCPSGFEWEPADRRITANWNYSLFFLGSLDWIPNQEGILWFISNVFNSIHKLHPDLMLYIAGRNAPKWFNQKISLPGIVFCGEIPDVREFILSKGIMVAPYFSGSGMRVKIIEAMAFGKPVITTLIGAEGLDVKHEENIIIADSAEDYCLQIEKLLKYPDFYMTIGRNAQAIIHQHYDCMKLATALSDFYKTHLE